MQRFRRPEDLLASYGLNNDGYQLSPIQAQEILNMRLHRITGLEQEKLTKEYEQILQTVRDLLEILSEPERLMEVIREELQDIRDRYVDERRTEILETRLDLSLEDLITEEDVVVTLSSRWLCEIADFGSLPGPTKGPGAANLPPRLKKKILSTRCLSLTPMTPYCASPVGAEFIG